MSGHKRAGEEDGELSYANKLQRLSDTHGNHQAAPTRKKVASSARTGQACDRCKVRKIRCDARPGGCSPCLQNNTECKTTDRITGRATQRGHTENLEHENATLRSYLADLQTQLRDSGLEPRAPPEGSQQPPLDHPGLPPYFGQPPDASHWDAPQSNGYDTSRNGTTHSQGSLLPEFRPGCIGDNYLGVASENHWLTPITGTSLALFGTKIDLAEFVPQEPNPDASAMSYQTFLTYAFGRSQPTTQPELPEYDKCRIYAEWYFRSIQVFIPILHKPDFMYLLEKIYHSGYQPNPAETVMVHTMLAVMNFQWSVRNGSEHTRSTSFEHYHYALSFIPQLITGHSLEDIQALTLICSHLRSQPRPGAAWMFTNMVLGLAIELGLHRSATAWKGASTEKSAHEIEMRKRIFWSLLVFHVTISGKLGRPMPLRQEDFDIEIPDPVDDSLPGEADKSSWRKCSFRAAIEGFKIVRIMMQVYGAIYSVRTTPGHYDVSVRQLEKDLDAFRAQIPPELSGSAQTREEDRVSALYLQMSDAECQLLLHHPSLCRANTPQLVKRNLDICLDASNTFLVSSVNLKQLKALDTTWYWHTDLIAAIFTTLFIHTERQSQMTSRELQQLRKDMTEWLDVLGEVGKMLGTGPMLQNAMHNIITSCIANIARPVAAKTASAAVASANSPSTTPAPSQRSFDTSRMYTQSYGNGSAAHSTPDSNQQYPMPMQAHYQSPQSEQNGTPAAFTYPDPRSSMTAYPAAEAKPPYDPASYGADDIQARIEAQLNAYPTANEAHKPQQQPTQWGVNAWRDFAQSMMTNMSGPEYMNSTNTMMPLGDAAAAAGANVLDGSLTNHNGMQMNGGGTTTAGMPTTNGIYGNMAMPSDGTQTWPLIHYGTGAAQSDT